MTMITKDWVEMAKKIIYLYDKYYNDEYLIVYRLCGQTMELEDAVAEYNLAENEDDLFKAEKYAEQIILDMKDVINIERSNNPYTKDFFEILNDN
jgi:hypothetical protein